MPGVDPEFVRVSLEIPRRLMPEYNARIGEFTVAHGIPVTVDEEPAHLVEYDVGLTSVVLERDSETGAPTGNQVRAITDEDLREFAVSEGETSNIGAMAFNNVSAALGYLGHTECLVPIKKADKYYPWTHFALRPAKAPTISELLQNDLRLREELTPAQRKILNSYFAALQKPQI